jgi:diacylglycerol kinase
MLEGIAMRFPDAVEPSPAPRKKPRPWSEKFREAFRGMKLGIRGHSSFYIHFFFAALVIAMAAVLECGWVEWCVLLMCIGMVFTAELFNSAIETLFHGLDAESKNRIQGCLDIAAGAVLMASITASVVGGIVFIRQFGRLWG